MWGKIFISIGFYVINLGHFTYGAKYIYKPNVNIYNHENWEGNGPQKKCEGLIYPSQTYGITTSKQLEIQQLVLGRDITFFFNDDTDLIFTENSKSIMNCVKLNSSSLKVHYWNDPKNWLFLDKENNGAVPHLERFPCQYDEVIFANGVLTGSVLISSPITVNTLKFGEDHLSNDNLLDFNNNPILKEIFLYNEDGGITINKLSCGDKSGCYCGNDIGYCDNIPEATTFDCLKPILPFGFCNKICGASIVFKPEASFKIKDIETKLKSYSSETHISKVKNKDQDYVLQIIFTEKEFSGDSLEEAKDFHKILQEDHSLQSHTLELALSGNYYKEGQSSAGSAITMIFISLFVACLIFGLLFLTFNKEGRFGNLGERFGLGSGPLTYRSVLFTRNRSISEGTGLIVDGQSIGGSLPNIPKSFDNPMFSEGRKKSPTTSESSDDPVEEVIKKITEDNQRGEEVDVFEDKERRELIESVAEDGDLVELTESN